MTVHLKTHVSASSECSSHRPASHDVRREWWDGSHLSSDRHAEAAAAASCCSHRPLASAPSAVPPASVISPALALQTSGSSADGARLPSQLAACEAKGSDANGGAQADVSAGSNQSSWSPSTMHAASHSIQFTWESGLAMRSHHRSTFGFASRFPRAIGLAADGRLEQSCFRL